MKYCFLFLVLLSWSVQSNAQNSDPLVHTLSQLDSIQHSNTIAKYFGGLYVNFLLTIETQLKSDDSTDKEMARKFEQVFAHYFIDASHAYETGHPIASPYWEAYFADTTLDILQYKLLGANAHLNGELWQALTYSFTAEEMKRFRPQFGIFRKTMNKLYTPIYREGYKENDKLLFLHIASIGTVKWVGNVYLYKWICRQMKLAQLYWAGSPRFERVLKRVERRKRFIDNIVVRVL
jgi:hypothetical protein